MFAGPNGSGKSTLKSILPPEMLGVYVNPDEIERDVRRSGFLDFKGYSVHCDDPGEVLRFFRQAQLLQRAGLAESVSLLGFRAGGIDFQSVPLNSYFASVAADFIRQKLLENRILLVSKR
jgi:hypothetical protein